MTVTTSNDGGIVTLTVDRPKALNAINSDVIESLAAAVEAVPADAIAVLVTGAGDKAFVAGADIAQMVDLGPEEAEAFSRRGSDVFQALADLPCPVIAAIDGFALGGGLELALACDILVAGDGAKLGLPESGLAVVPGFGGTQRLPRRVGGGHAKRLMFTGARIGAEEALAIGLVDMVCPAGQALQTARELADAIARNGPLAVRECKRLIELGADMDLADSLSLESSAFGAIFATVDRREGMQAFMDKRKPAYRGE